jgi:hypothetical protein
MTPRFLITTFRWFLRFPYQYLCQFSFQRELTAISASDGQIYETSVMELGRIGRMKLA